VDPQASTAGDTLTRSEFEATVTKLQQPGTAGELGWKQLMVAKLL
jgi:hypothetical protein